MIVRLNFKVFSNMMTLDANLVLITVLSFRGGIPHSIQAFSHSYLPFPDFFVHNVIVFCKAACTSFTLTCTKHLETLLPLVAY
jgi:hypothetical protein